MNQSLQSKLVWSCRRGMKELDLLLMPYAKTQLMTLSVDELQGLDKLLALDDLTLFSYFFQSCVPPDPLLAQLVTSILQYSLCGKPN